MGRIVVDVMLKPEILDPQGQAVAGALPRLGFEHFTDVRQGKRFVLTVEGDPTDEHLAAAREAAATLLSNPVIEDVVSVHVLDEDAEAAPVDAAADEDEVVERSEPESPEPESPDAEDEAQPDADAAPEAEGEGEKR